MLIICFDIDGLYMVDFCKDVFVILILIVEYIDEIIYVLVGGVGIVVGIGGMCIKI